MKFSPIRLDLILVATAVSLLTIVTAHAQSGSNTTARALIEKSRGSIAVITGEDKAGQPIAPGLGFVIGRNLIATNSFVVVPSLRLHVSLSGQDSAAMMNVSYSDSYRRATIMTLVAGSLAGEPLTIGDIEKIVPKQRVYLFDDPGPQGQILEAVVRRITTINDRRYFELSVPFKASIRGGPVFNDNGEVIGIFSESPEGPHLSLAVPASYLTTLLKARNPEPTAGISSSAIKTTTGPGYGVGSGDGKGPEGAPSVGPGQPSGGAGVGPRENATPTTSPVTTKPKMLNSGRPMYTEIARRNQTQGVVAIRLVVGADGNVKQARLIKGLPDGLNEQAVEAVFKLKFQPATRDGLPVDYSLSLQVEFNLR
jgi:protein TonB